ncbi:MAG: hypothetical protein ACC707_11950, partial [Thiohalomonadales bacterium]
AAVELICTRRTYAAKHMDVRKRSGMYSRVPRIAQRSYVIPIPKLTMRNVESGFNCIISFQ